MLAAVTLVYLVAVGLITLLPQSPDSTGSAVARAIVAALRGFPPTAWVTYDGAEFTANIVMFVPMGVLFTLLLGVHRWWLALVIGVAATCLIEGAQLVIPGRFSDVRDLVANSLGTLIGIGIVGAATAARRPLAVRE